MDSDDIDRIAKAVVKYLTPLVKQLVLSTQRSSYRLSHQALEQRRAAGFKNKKPVDKSVDNSRHTDPPTESVTNTTTSPNSVDEQRNPLPKPRKKSKPSSESAELSTAIFLAYATAFKLRYGAFPVRNARVNGMLVQFIKRIPAAEAPEVAAFYVASEEQLYVRGKHCIDLLLRDAEGIRMQWATGRKVAPVNGVASTIAKPWWESWSALLEQGRDLGLELEEGGNPTIFKNQVLRAAFVAGRLPIEIATAKGVPTHGRPDHLPTTDSTPD